MTAGPSLPRGVRLATVLLLVLSTIGGLVATNNALLLTDPDTLPPPAGVQAPEELRRQEVELELARAIFRAVRPVRGMHAFALVGLSFAHMLALVAGLRLFRPAGLPRSRLLRLLANASIAAAFLHAVLGAQWLALMQRLAGPLMRTAEALATFPDEASRQLFYEALPDMPRVLSVLCLLLTALLAGPLLALGQFLRSERVQRQVALLEPSEG